MSVPTPEFATVRITLLSDSALPRSFPRIASSCKKSGVTLDPIDSVSASIEPPFASKMVGIKNLGPVCGTGFPLDCTVKVRIPTLSSTLNPPKLLLLLSMIPKLAPATNPCALFVSMV